MSCIRVIADGGPKYPVPRHPVDILVDIRIAKFIDHAAPQLVGVIENPDLCVERSFLQRRAEVALHKILFVFLARQRLWPS
jgi:hypothetical protein